MRVHSINSQNLSLMQNSYIRLALLLVFLLALMLPSCQSDDASRMNGYWKLTTIRLPNQQTIVVDSQFYAIQKENIFSFTRLVKSDDADISYGYADYPSDSQVHLLMDKNHTGSDFPILSHWKAFEATFNIQEVNSSNLILEKGDSLFILKRY